MSNDSSFDVCREKTKGIQIKIRKMFSKNELDLKKVELVFQEEQLIVDQLARGEQIRSFIVCVIKRFMVAQIIWHRETVFWIICKEAGQH